jgi:hypothetical protein
MALHVNLPYERNLGAKKKCFFLFFFKKKEGRGEETPFLPAGIPKLIDGRMMSIGR